MERLRLKGLSDGCTKDYTVVREEDYCDFDGSRIVSGLKCLALVDIQEETEFPETLCVCRRICPAEAVVRTERLCGERLYSGGRTCSLFL